MDAPGATPPGGKSKKRRQQMIIAGVALAGLLLLYLRSRSSSSSSSSTNTQAAAAAAAQQQAQLDQSQYAASGGGGGTPSTFADNGAQAAALGDAVTQGLSGVQAALSSLQQPGAAVTDTTLPGPDNSPAPTQITINNTPAGQPAGSPAKAAAKPLPPPPAGGGHYVLVNGKPQLIHATGKNTWAPGPPPKKPPIKATGKKK